jgi:hypothetical protein
MATTEAKTHVRIACSEQGAAVVLVHEDGREQVVSFTWDQWKAFVQEHAPVTSSAPTAGPPLRWSSAGMFLEHAFATKVPGAPLAGALSLCGGPCTRWPALPRGCPSSAASSVRRSSRPAKARAVGGERIDP